MQGVVYDAGSLWAVDGLNQWLFKIDPASGARTVVSGSSRAPKVGTGSAPIEAHWISLAGSTVYTSGGFADANVDLTAVDVATGDRTAPPAWVGPATTANLGGWDETPNWPIPGSTILVVGIDEALVLVDVTTGNSNLLSY